MTKLQILIALSAAWIVIAFIFAINDTHAFVDYDETIQNPFNEFTIDNVEHFSYIPMYYEQINGLEGLTVFPLKSLRYLMNNGITSLRWFDDRFKFPFNVTLNYSADDYGIGQGYYNIWRVGGETSKAEVLLVGSMMEVDHALVHELQHIFTAHKSGKMLTTDAEHHDTDPNEQIAMTNDILRLMELKYKRGVTWERLEHYGNMMIANYERQKLPERVFQWRMSIAIFKSYINQ